MGGVVVMFRMELCGQEARVKFADETGRGYDARLTNKPQ